MFPLSLFSFHDVIVRILTWFFFPKTVGLTDFSLFFSFVCACEESHKKTHGIPCPNLA